jgi:hypothetical protein
MHKGWFAKKDALKALKVPFSLAGFPFFGLGWPQAGVPAERFFPNYQDCSIKGAH